MMGPVGCPACNDTGYRGRQAIFELMMMNADLRQAAFDLAPVAELRRRALGIVVIRAQWFGLTPSTRCSLFS